MKKITILALHLGYGGIEKYLSSLTTMLKEDYKIKIISTYRLYDTPPFDFSGVEIEYLTDKPFKEELKESIKKKDIFNILKYLLLNIKIIILKYIKNIVAIKNIKSDYIITTRTFHNFLVGLFAHRKIVRIATEHNHHNNDVDYISKVVKSVKNMDYLVLVSKELKDFYSPLVKETKCVHIPNVIDKLADKPNKLNNYNLVSIGRLSPEKGFDDLVLVMEQLVKINKKYHLDLIGDGPLFKEIKNLIIEKKLEDHISMHGFLNHDQIDEVIKDDSMYVMTSHSESFGIVLIEAMSYGLPCIAFSSARGACEVISQKNLLIKNRDIKLMASAINDIMIDKKAVKFFGRENYVEAEKYLASNVAENWFKILK